jgi:hypothetical protein
MELLSSVDIVPRCCEGKVGPGLNYQAMGGWRYTYIILNLDASFKPLQLYPRYSLYSRLGKPQSRCGLYGGRKKSLTLTGNHTPDSSVVRLAIPAPTNPLLY